MYKLILIFLVSIFAISSCNTFKVDYSGKADSLKHIEKIAILNVYICPPIVPEFPLIAVNFKTAFKKIHRDITAFNEQNADSVLIYLGKEFEKINLKKVIYGENLYSILTQEKINENNIKTYPPIIDNEEFPKIPQPKNSFNYFNFTNESTPEDIFSKRKLLAYKPELKKICSILDVDAVVVSYFSVKILGVTAYGGTANMALDGELYFFNKNGDYIGKGVFTSDKLETGPTNFDNYKNLFSEYYTITPMLLRKIFYGENPKK